MSELDKMYRENVVNKKKIEPNGARELVKPNPHLYADNVKDCKKLSLNEKYGGEYQVLIRDLLDSALKDKRLLKRVGVLK